MTSPSDSNFKRNYQSHLKGLQPKTIDAYARAIRRIGAYFDYQIDDLSEVQLTDYFTDLPHSLARREPQKWLNTTLRPLKIEPLFPAGRALS